MEAYEALTTRRTIHDYAPEPVDEAALMRALEAALTAPNHRMTEPWRFILVGPQTRAEIAEIAVAVKEQKGQLTEDAKDRVRAKVLNPAELIVLVQAVDEDPDTEREDYAAIACAVQNLTVSLWADGIGSKWSTGGVTRTDQTYAVLGVTRPAERIVGFLWVGVPSGEMPKARRRKTLADVLRSVP